MVNYNHVSRKGHDLADDSLEARGNVCLLVIRGVMRARVHFKYSNGWFNQVNSSCSLDSSAGDLVTAVRKCRHARMLVTVEEEHDRVVVLGSVNLVKCVTSCLTHHYLEVVTGDDFLSVLHPANCRRRVSCHSTLQLDVRGLVGVRVGRVVQELRRHCRNTQSNTTHKPDRNFLFSTLDNFLQDSVLQQRFL